VLEFVIRIQKGGLRTHPRRDFGSNLSLSSVGGGSVESAFFVSVASAFAGFASLSASTRVVVDELLDTAVDAVGDFGANLSLLSDESVRTESSFFVSLASLST
jgi:hypothetical protein